MSKDAGRGADEIGTAGLMGGEGDDDGRGEGQGHVARHGGPADHVRALGQEGAEEAGEEALAGRALAQLSPRPGGREARAVLGALGIVGDDGGRAQGVVHPGDEGGAPVGGIKAHHAGAQAIEGDGQGEQGLREGGIVGIGGGQAEEQRQAGAAAEQRVDAVATQQGRGMVCGGMAVAGIRVGAPPRFERGAIDNQVACSDEADAQRFLDRQDEERLAGWGTGVGGALPLLRGRGHPGRPVRFGRQATRERQGRPRLNQAVISRGERRQSVRSKARSSRDSSL